MRGKHYVFMDDQLGAAGGGQSGAPAGAAATGAPSGGAGAGVPASAGANSGAPAGSVLAAGALASPAATGAAPGPNDWIPEKHRVLKEDQTLDLEASARKVAEAYGAAEKRIGSGDIPPKTADEYKLNVPEALAATFKAEDLAKDPLTKEFLGKAHAAGLTQKQVDFAMSEFLTRATGLTDGVKQLDHNDCVSKLKETWKNEADYNKNLGAAFRAGKQYAGEDFDGILKDYGNDPRVVRMLAKVGSEMQEDTGAPAGAQGQTAAAALKTEHDALAIYLNNGANRNQPEYAAKNQRYAQLGAQLFGTGARKSGAVTVGAL